MNDAAQEARPADPACGSGPEEQLRFGDGRVPARTRPSDLTSWRLKRSIEVFRADSGSVLLLRSGVADDFILERPRPTDLVVLECLRAGWVDEQQLRSHLIANRLNADDLASSLIELEAVGLTERREQELLSATEQERFDRQLVYFSDLGTGALPPQAMQSALNESSVAILGCGGLGSWVACGLACAGVGSMLLVDDDRVELSNLHRQLLFGEPDIGTLKVTAAKAALMRHSPTVRVATSSERVSGTSDVGKLLADVDFFVLTADWPQFELPRWVNAACLRAKTPWISAGQFLPKVRIGPMVVPGSACLVCLEHAAKRQYPLYDELSSRPRESPVAATLGPACGLIGSLMAMEVIHYLVAGAAASIGQVLTLDLRTWQVHTDRVEREPQCPSCGAG